MGCIRPEQDKSKEQEYIGGHKREDYDLKNQDYIAQGRDSQKSRYGISSGELNTGWQSPCERTVSVVQTMYD